MIIYQNLSPGLGMPCGLARVGFCGSSHQDSTAQICAVTWASSEMHIGLSVWGVASESIVPTCSPKMLISDFGYWSVYILLDSAFLGCSSVSLGPTCHRRTSTTITAWTSFTPCRIPSSHSGQSSLSPSRGSSLPLPVTVSFPGVMWPEPFHWELLEPGFCHLAVCP